MATVEAELRELKARVGRLEQIVRELREGSSPAATAEIENLSERERALAILKAKGLIRDLTPEEQALAAEWQALSEEEKQAHIQLMKSLVLDPPLSQIIIENRR
jgi:ABC-type metal ion transport system substrate-binding protein